MPAFHKECSYEGAVIEVTQGAFFVFTIISGQTVKFKFSAGTLHTFYLLAVLVDTGDGKFHPFCDVGAVIADPLKVLGDHQKIQRIFTL